MSEIETIKLDGVGEIALGLTMPTDEEQLLMASVQDYPDDLLLDDADIKKLLPDGFYLEQRKRWQYRMRNQGSLGKCNASSNASGLEQLFELQGLPYRAISDCYIYSLVNGGRDRGSALISTFKQMQERGASPMELQVGGLTKRLANDFFNRSQVPRDILAQADIEAKRFKGWEFYRAPTNSFSAYARTVASALARRQPVVFAWHVGGASSRLRNGYAIVGRGVGNHSNLLQSAKFVGGQDIVHPDDRNSWGPCTDPLYGRTGGPGWGENGHALFTMGDVWACAKNHDTYIMTSAKADPNDPAFQ